MDVHEAVENGIRWANEVIPDWHEHVKSEGFDILDGRRCFLGQYWAATSDHEDRGFSPYEAARREYSGHDEFLKAWLWALKHGFSADPHLNTNYTWQQLGDAWVRKLQEKGL